MEIMEKLTIECKQAIKIVEFKSFIRNSIVNYYISFLKIMILHLLDLRAFFISFY